MRWTKLLWLLVLAIATESVVAAGGGALAKWAGPLTIIGETLAGDVAFFASLSLMVVGVIPLAAGGELGNGMGRFFNLIMWIGIMILAGNVITTLWGVGGALI